MKNLMSFLVVILPLLLGMIPTSAFAADTVDKTICKLAVGYQDVDEIKADLLVAVKREVINELFGEMIVASTAVENFVVTSDQIRTSSIGFVRVEGNADFVNGKGFAEVCVTIHAYVTDEDRAKFNPEKLKKKYCDADDDLTTAQLIAYVKDESIIQSLIEYNPKLKGADKESLLQLVQKVTYLESGFISDTQTYCAEFEGYVVPIEVTAFLETDSSAEQTTELPVDEYAYSVISHVTAGVNNSHANPEDVLGSPICGAAATFFSLGGGYIILDMGEAIKDKDGTDLRVHEVGPKCQTIAGDEPYEVYISTTAGGPWKSLGQGQGIDEFDLAVSGIAEAQYVKLEDRSPNQPDSGASPGADINAVEALH